MKTLISIIIGFWILIATVTICFRTMNVMLVHDRADIYLDSKVCPVPLTQDGICSVNGSLTHNLLGDVEITMADGSVLIVQDDSIKGMSYQESHYRPFGDTCAFILGLVILLVGVATAFQIPLHRFLTRTMKIKDSTT